MTDPTPDELEELEQFEALPFDDDPEDDTDEA
jgi:hypothetical protein